MQRCLFFRLSASKLAPLFLLLCCCPAWGQVPTLTAASPRSGVQGATIAVALAGTAFTPSGTTLALSGANTNALSVHVTSVPANGQVSMFLSEIPGLGTIPPGFRGMLRIFGAEVSVIGLRSRTNQRGDFLITTTPPADESSPPLATEYVFPHLANSAGYTTQVILFNSNPGQTVGGVVRFYDQSGAPADLGIR